MRNHLCYTYHSYMKLKFFMSLKKKKHRDIFIQKKRETWLPAPWGSSSGKWRMFTKGRDSCREGGQEAKAEGSSESARCFLVR